MYSACRHLTLGRAAFSRSFSVPPGQTSVLCSDRRVPCINPNRKCSGKRYNVPPSSEFVSRVSGIPTWAKLPFQETADGLDAAIVGVPIDTGTSNRPGARFGPRQIRVESAMLRLYNCGTRAAPYESIMVADIGDVNVNLYDLKDTCKRIREHYRKIVTTGCIPLTMGGDHTIAYPILQAVAEKHGPVGLVHVDAHADTGDEVLGEKITHGTPFRRCVEEGLLDCKRVVQIGLRGTGYTPDAYEWSRAQGFRVVQVEECWFKSLAPLMAEVRAQMGSGPVYLSFDIDALDPGFAPGTGTPEIAGLTPIQGVEIVRGCRGLNLVGCDLVEVSPPYDTTERFGPRQIRAESTLLRAYNSGTRAAPYESLMVADIGDVNVNLYDLKDTCKRIREHYRKIVATGCIPLTMGGDHTIAYPILQAVAEKYGPVGLVQVDAHADTSDVVLGEKVANGTPFRRCVEEGLLDCKRVVQIGLWGTGFTPDAYEWSRAQGFRVVQVEECWFKSLAPLMAEVRAQMGGGPVYLSFDIDALDPGFAPGTGTPEIAGLTSIQGVEIVRGCRGLNLVGCDLVEVSPPYDTTGNTALSGANLLFEVLCVLPKMKYY